MIELVGFFVAMFMLGSSLYVGFLLTRWVVTRPRWRPMGQQIGGIAVGLGMLGVSILGFGLLLALLDVAADFWRDLF